MKFTTDKIQWTDSMKEFTEITLKKKLDRLVDDPAECEVKTSKLNDECIKVEVSFSKFRAQAVHSDFYVAVVEAASKLKSIIVRSKKRTPKYEQISMFDLDPEVFPDVSLPRISKQKLFELTPMSLDDAIEMFECTDYPFFVYKDINDNNNIAIIYKRFGETLGLIRCY